MSNNSEVMVLARAPMTRKRANKRKTLPSVVKLLGRPPLLPGEKLQDFEAFVLALSDDLKPGTSSEWPLVNEIAQLKWISARFRRAEACLLYWDLNQAKDPTAPPMLAHAIIRQMSHIQTTSYWIFQYDERCDVL